MTSRADQIAALRSQIETLEAAPDGVIDEAELYDTPATDAGKDVRAGNPRACAVSAADEEPYDFDDLAKAEAQLQERCSGLPWAKVNALIDSWEAQQRASIWSKVGYTPPRRDGFHGPLRYREISVA